MRSSADKEGRNITGALLGIISVFLLFIAASQSTYASEPNTVDNGDYTYTATWEFDDMTNYTVSNLTGSNGQVNLTKSGYYWNQSSLQDFSGGQGSNVIGGDGVAVNPDELVLGYLPNQNFTTPNNWVYVNSTDSEVVSQWSPSENGWLYSSHPRNTTTEIAVQQPDAINGIDTFLNESDVLINYGDNETLIIGNDGQEQRALLWFDITSYLDSKVTDVKLELYFYNSSEATSADISVHRITGSWAEMNTNWQDSDTLVPWGTPGGDFDAAAFDTATGLTNNYGWKSWNITSLVDDWVNGTYENYGLLLYIPAGTPGEKRFYSSDCTITSLRPKLNVTYDPFDTFNETAYISYEFQLLDEGSYIDTTISDFELGTLSNITTTPANSGEITLDSTGYLKFDALDNVTEWEEDPDTKVNSGTFVLSNTIFYEGTGSMKLDYNLASTQQSYGVMRTAATSWDWSSFNGLEVWVRSSWQGEVMKVVIEDTNAVSWQSNPVPPTSSWEKYTFDLSGFPGDISSIYAIKFHFSDTTLGTTTYLDNVTLLGGSPYFPEGLFESRIIDAGYKVPWSRIYWEEDIPAGTDIKIRTRTGNTSTPDASWSGWSSLYTTPNGSSITSPEGRYIQYMVYLNSTDPDYTPRVSEVTLVKLEYNLTFYYSVDAYSNVTWANIFMKLDGEILWEKIVNQTISGDTAYFDIGRRLTDVGNKSVEFGLTVNANSTNDVNISTLIDDFQIRGPTGFYISKIFDAGSETNWEKVTWNADFTLNTNLTLTTRTSIDNLTWSSWSDTLQFDKDNLTNPDGSYIQYRINFTTQILGVTPVFKWINITHNKYQVQGTLTFNNDLVVGNVTNWGTFAADSILQGQSITYEYSINSGNNWYQVPNDGNLSFVSTSTNKIRFRAIFEAYNTSMTPTLDSINLTYSVNQPPTIIGLVPNQNWPEDGGFWILDLNPYESDYEDSGADLRWYITGENTSLYTVDGEYSNDDVITFTPLSNVSGSNQVELWLQDSNGAITSQNLWINITPVNDAPTIIGLLPSFEKNEDSPDWNYDLSVYKFDVDNISSELSWQVVGWDPLLFDSVNIIGDLINFDLAQNATGNDEMTIMLSDGLLIDTQNIWVNVTAMNDAPIIMGIIPDFDKSEDDLDWILDLTSNESDVEDGSPSASLTWSVSNVDSNLLSITISDNNLTFSLKSDAYGNNEITIILTDSGGLSVSQNIWVNVTPENDAPVILGIIPDFEKDEDTPNWNYDVTAYESDVDNISSELYWQVIGWDPLLFDSVSSFGDVIYFDFAQNAYGNDQMTLTLSDGVLTDSQNIWVNVTPVNDAPTIIGMIPDFDINEDDMAWVLDLTSYESDVEDPSPSGSLTWSVANVDSILLSITISDNNLTFTLKPDAYGNDDLTIILTDSLGVTDSQNIWVNVTSENDAPKIIGNIPNFDKQEDAENWEIELSPYKSDIDNISSELFWSVSGWSTALFDSVSITGDILSFDLAANVFANDEITISLSDGILTDTQNIWVNVTSVNDAPVIATTIPDIKKAEDSPNWTLDLTSYENDIEDGSPSSSLSWSVTNINTSLLSILISDNNITFTLVENASGYDQITITLTDGGGKTISQDVFIEIISVNDGPIIQPAVPNVVTNEDKNTLISLLTYGSDIEDSQGQLRWWLGDADSTLYSWYIDPLTNTLYIDPLSNAYGTDDATLILTDSDGSSASQPIQIVIVPVNDAPYISPQIPQSYFEALEDQPITVILTGFENDVEDSNALLTWSAEGVNTSIMKVSIDTAEDEVVIVPIVEFLPGQTENVESEITLILTDSDGLEDRQDIIVIFCPINNAPVIGDLPNVMVKYDEPYVIDLLPYVFDEDTPRGQLVITTSEPSEDQGSGYISVTGLNLTFLYPQSRVDEVFIIVVMVSDGQFTSYTTMQVEISDNSPPQLLNPLPNVNFDEDTNVTGAFDLDDYFTDPEGGNLNFTFYLQYMHHGGEFIFVTIKNDNTVDFLAVQDWYGQEQITFRGEDAQGAIVEGTTAITVNPVNDAPVIFGLSNQVCKINETKVLDIQPFISDVDDPIGDLTVSTNSANINVLGHELTFLYDEAITENVVIIVSDGFLENSITIEVTASSNIPPSFSIIPELVVKGGEVYLFSFKPYVSDVDNPQADLHIWTNSIYTNPNAVDNMLLEIDFPVDMIGEDVIVTVFISDGLNVNSTGMLIHIANESIPELLRSLPNIFLDEDSVLIHALYLNDYFQNSADYQFFGNDKINITIDNGWLSLSSSGNWSGTETITIRGLQGIAFVEDTIEVTVRPVNDPPVLSPFPSFNKTLNEIWTLNLIGYIHDIDTPITDLVINVDSPHVIIYSFNLYFQYQYEINEIITVTVIDGESSVSGGIYVNVTAENNPPTYVGLLDDFQIKPGETWSIDLDDFFYDMDGDLLTFSCNRAEVSINPVTHVATWTPKEEGSTIREVIFSATDGDVTIESSAIDLVLDAQEQGPSFWETNWWLVIAILAIVISLVLAFVLMKRKEREGEEIEYDIDVDKAVEFLASGGGGAFTIKSSGPEKSYEVFSRLMQSGFDGMCITTKEPEKLMGKYNLGKAWIIKLTLRGKKDSEGEDEETKMMGLLALGDEAGEGEKYIFSSNFNRIVETIEDFLMAGDNKVVLLDGLEYILGGDELVMYVGFIASIKERLKNRNSCLLLPIDPKTLSEKELRLLERETLELGKTLQESAKGIYEVPSHLVPQESAELVEAGTTNGVNSEDMENF